MRRHEDDCDKVAGVENGGPYQCTCREAEISALLSKAESDAEVHAVAIAANARLSAEVSDLRAQLSEAKRKLEIAEVDYDAERGAAADLAEKLQAERKLRQEAESESRKRFFDVLRLSEPPPCATCGRLVLVGKCCEGPRTWQGRAEAAESARDAALLRVEELEKALRETHAALVPAHDWLCMPANMPADGWGVLSVVTDATNEALTVLDGVLPEPHK